MAKHVLMSATLVLCAGVAARTQGGSSFDVASIKRNLSGESQIRLDISRGQVLAINTPVRTLIRQAFDVLDSQIVDAPEWVGTERYDVNAKAPAGVTTADAMRPLLRALLAERFKLATRMEKREMPVYALVKARDDGTPGPSLRLSAVDCGATTPTAPPSAPGTTNEWPACAVSFAPGAVYIGGYAMREVLRLLTPLVGRTILDETGITGAVQMKLQYRPGNQTAATDLPDLFTALQEQAGLKLVPQRAAIDVLVIERIERPTVD